MDPTPTIMEGFTFEQLLVEVGLRVGFVDYDESTDKPIPPKDPTRLDKLKRAVSLGYRAFLKAHPRWTFLERAFELTFSPDGSAAACIGGESWRYRMPDFIRGNPKGDWKYLDDMSCLQQMRTTNHPHILGLHARTQTGTPTYASVHATTPDRRNFDQPVNYELIVYPKPAAAYRVGGMFRITPPELTGLSDRHIAGYEHDDTILLYCVYSFARFDRPDAVEPRDELAKSIAIDNATRARRPAPFSSGLEPGRRTFNVGGIDLV